MVLTRDNNLDHPEGIPVRNVTRCRLLPYIKVVPTEDHSDDLRQITQDAHLVKTSRYFGLVPARLRRDVRLVRHALGSIGPDARPADAPVARGISNASASQQTRTQDEAS